MEVFDNLPLSSGCEILAVHPCGLLAINKKAGRSVHPNPNAGKGDKPPMLRAKYNFDGEYYSWLDEGGERRRLYLINRLDSPTSGVVLAAVSRKVADAAKAQFKLKNVEKIYKAIVLGRVFPNAGVWVDALEVKAFGHFVRSAAGGAAGAARRASAAYATECFDENGLNLSLIRLEPKTGLTHQLRVQCARRRHPILGDATYGDFARNKYVKNLSGLSRLFLHCQKTSIAFGLEGEKIAFSAEAPLPESFEKILRYNGQLRKKTF